MHTMRRVKHMKEDEEGAKHTTKSSTHRPFSVCLSLSIRFFSPSMSIYGFERKKYTERVKRASKWRKSLHTTTVIPAKSNGWKMFNVKLICFLTFKAFHFNMRLALLSSSLLLFFIVFFLPLAEDSLSLSLYATACFHLCSLIILDASIIDSSTRLSWAA